MRHQTLRLLPAMALLSVATGGFSQTTPPATRPGITIQNAGGRGTVRVPDIGKLPDSEKKPFPSADPKVVARRLALNQISRPQLMGWRMQGVPVQFGAWYGEVCTSFGALRVADLLKDKEIADAIVKRYQPILTPEGANIKTSPGHVDNNVFGIVPFQIFLYNGDKAFLDVGKFYADEQWTTPARPLTAEEKAAVDMGLTYQTRFWIDDMFMITALQVQAFRATKDAKYLDHAATAMVAYLDRLQKPNGLFYHGESSPFFWGRGNGWVAVGLTELLSELPKEHKHHARVLAGYHKMMTALLENQAPEGMWRQLVDKPASWPESSCTGMFTFAFARGVKLGWLDAAKYKEPTERAWKALSGYVDEDGNIREVCIGTNKGTSEEFYLARPRRVGDPHGQAGSIWAAWAMMQGLEK